MRTVRKPVTATEISVYELGEFTDANCNSFVLQAPTGNVETVYFGQSGNPVGEVVVKNNVSVDERSLRNTFVKGTVGDDIIIIVS